MAERERSFPLRERDPRFRPPPVKPDALGRPGHLPQIRLDRAMQFLIGDRLT